MLHRTTHSKESTLMNGEKRCMSKDMLRFFEIRQENMMRKMKFLSGHLEEYDHTHIKFFEDDDDDEAMEDGDVYPDIESDYD